MGGGNHVEFAKDLVVGLSERCAKVGRYECTTGKEFLKLIVVARVSAKNGLPALTFVYDGFLQLHVENGENRAAAVKLDAEAALLAYFKSPIYLIEKPFFEAVGIAEEDDDTDLVVPPA